ncbi:MAG: DUF2326 domain-containing protein [Clostridium sp.]|nr:DUF2326 domain-containing protein [Clostridium sp.]
MRLIRVYSNMESFKEVKFNKAGLSFIAAKQKNPEITKKGQTYNGVGKSLLVRIIHFCLGANKRDYKGFCDKLPEWEFYLEFEIKNTMYTAKRSTDNPDRIFLNGENLSVDKFNKKMGELCFNIPEDISCLSFRSLIPFFIRPKRESYVSYNKPGKVHRDYQLFLYNAFLLGLDVFLMQKKQEIKKEKDRINELENNFKKDSLLRDFFTGNKDVALTLIDLDEQIKKLDESLKNFKVADDYYDVQIEADKIERELFDLNNEIIMLQNNIKSIDGGLNINPDINKDDIKKIYEEASIYFPESVTKKLDELNEFYEKLIINRKKRLLEQRNRLDSEIKNKEEKTKLLKKELDGLMQYLGEHQALDVFVSLSNKSAELKSKRNSLKKYQDLQREYKEKERNADKDLISLAETTEKYLKQIEPEISKLINYFRFLAKKFYPNTVAGLKITANDGDNQLLFDIDAKIESDTSDGINNVKIFCYDLTILFKGCNHNIDFIFHDSRLFDGIDERQKADMFKIAYEEFSKSGKQYIATVNQNQIDEIRRLMTQEDFKNIIVDNTILTLTDESDAGKLLGIRVDIDDE